MLSICVLQQKYWKRIESNWRTISMGVLLGTNWTILVLHWTTRPMFCEIYLECDSHLVLGWFSANTPQTVTKSPPLRLWRPQYQGLLPGFHRTGPRKWKSLWWWLEMNLKIEILYIFDLLVELFAGHSVPISRDQAIQWGPWDLGFIIFIFQI